MKKVVKLFLAVVLLLCIQGAVNTESAYSKMKTYKEGKTYTLTGKVQRINYEHPNGRHFIVYLLKLDKKFKIKTELAGKTKASKVQLALMYSGDNKKNKLYKLRGKHVKVRGKLYGRGTAYYAVPIYMMEMKSIKRIFLLVK